MNYGIYIAIDRTNSIKLFYTMSITPKKTFLIFLMAAILVNCNSIKSWKNSPKTKEDETYIYVVSHGWHTGVVILQENIGEELQFFNRYFGISPYYEIGWGDKGFYEAEEITTKITFQALFIPTESVLHVVAVSKDPRNYFSNSEIIRIPISKNAHRILNQTIYNSFQTNEKGEVIKTRRGIYGNSYFFAGNGFYYITNTCNTWTARILEKSGLPISSFLTLTARSVMSQSKEAIESYHCCIENFTK